MTTLCNTDIQDILTDEIMVNLDFDVEVQQHDFVENIEGMLLYHLEQEGLEVDEDVTLTEEICGWVLSNLMDEEEVNLLCEYDSIFNDYVNTIENIEDFLMS